MTVTSSLGGDHNELCTNLQKLGLPGAIVIAILSSWLVRRKALSYNPKESNASPGSLRNMPIYEFRCKKCNAHIEVFQKLSDKQPTRCKKCGGRLEKQISAPAAHFKGEGWYVTDYARKGSVAEKVEKELSSPEPSSNSDKDKSKKTPAKKDKA